MCSHSGGGWRRNMKRPDIWHSKLNQGAPSCPVMLPERRQLGNYALRSNAHHAWHGRWCSFLRLTLALPHVLAP